MHTIFDFVKEQRTNYRSHTIQIADGYDYSQYETLPTIELYHNSKFATGQPEARKAVLQHLQIPGERRHPSFLNKMGSTRAKYGGVLVKKGERAGELCLHVMQWRNMITD
jgi:hypothetical protein